MLSDRYMTQLITHSKSILPILYDIIKNLASCERQSESMQGNSSAQDFALAAKSVRMCRLSKESSPLLKANFNGLDSVTVRAKAELLLCRYYSGGHLSSADRSGT